MKKHDWWFKFEHLKWLTDEQLNRCSLETQGFWIRCICVMRKSGTAMIEGTGPELLRLLGVTGAELKRCFNDLAKTKAADVTLCHASVTQKSAIFRIVSRKIRKELKTKEQNRLRKQRERRHADVTPPSRDRVKSKSNKKEEEKNSTNVDLVREGTPARDEHPAVTTYREFYPNASLDLPRQILIEDRVDNLTAWRKTLTYWQQNGYRANSVGKMIDCMNEAGYERNGNSKRPNTDRQRDTDDPRSSEDVARELGIGV